MTDSNELPDPSAVLNSKRKLSAEEPDTNKMMPSLFMECHPIDNPEDLADVVRNPPRWIQRVNPIAPRSQFVVQNTLSSCHTEKNHFAARKRLDARTVPKTLVCHDYKGGYQADKYLHYPYEEIVGSGYTFYNWAQIDVFVYFSHHLITIPPLCWINVAHNNGVKILGTIITEFADGKKLCDEKIFKDTYSMREFTTSLVDLTRIFGFDGWLLNIENRVDNIHVLKEFVPLLSEMLHQENSGSLVVWYDSVTEAGELLWQNELNDKNKYFFDCCDGIFLNYSWNEQNLMKSAEEAKHRNLDVYVGIDVFGRNFFGGGMFNTYKAVEVVTRCNLSMAIFAPGWTHETLGKVELLFYKFYNRDSAFWCSLWPYLYTHPLNNYFTTNFYIGLDEYCYNIFSQQQQLTEVLRPKLITPEFSEVPNIKSQCDCLQIHMLDTKNNCLITKKNLRRDTDHIHYLFACDLKIVDNTVVFFLTKGPSDLKVTLLVSGFNRTMRKIELLTESKVNPLNSSTVLEVNPSESTDILSSLTSRYYNMIMDNNWNLRVYVFNTLLCEVLEIGGVLENGDHVYLGAFGIESADGNFLKSK
nr:unnamed protein product [Callosobruchus analis]